MTELLSVFVACILQDVGESKNNFLVYNPFSIKVFTAGSLIKSLGTE